MIGVTPILYKIIVTTPPSRGGALPPLPPLRTVRETFASHGSSLDNAR
jgi:hypothetical protein